MSLLSRRDWTYLLSLLVPFILYDLILKGSLVLSWPKELAFAESFRLMRSDLLFCMGYALLWFSLFAVAKQGLWRMIVTFLFHADDDPGRADRDDCVPVFQGNRFDARLLASFYISLSSPGGLVAVVQSEVSPGILTLLVAVLAYAVLGPFLVTRLDDRWRGRLDAEPGQLVFHGFAWPA